MRYENLKSVHCIRSDRSGSVNPALAVAVIAAMSVIIVGGFYMILTPDTISRDIYLNGTDESNEIAYLTPGYTWVSNIDGTYHLFSDKPEITTKSKTLDKSVLDITKKSGDNCRLTVEFCKQYEHPSNIESVEYYFQFDDGSEDINYFSENHNLPRFHVSDSGFYLLALFIEVETPNGWVLQDSVLYENIRIGMI